MNLFKICRKKQKRGKSSRTDSVSFSQSLGRISGRIQFINNISVFFGFPGHFNDSRAVIGDGSENIHRENISGCCEHSHCGDSRSEKSSARNSRKFSEVKRSEKRHAYGKNGERG